jgi:hypothetical protein
MAVRHEVPLYSVKPDFNSDRERPRLSELLALPRISYHPTLTAYGIPDTLTDFRHDAEEAHIVVLVRHTVTDAESAVFQAVCKGTITAEDALARSPFHPKYDVFEYKQTESELNAIAGLEKPIFFLGPDASHPIAKRHEKLERASYAPHDARAWLRTPLPEVAQNMNRYFSEFAELEYVQSMLTAEQMRHLPQVIADRDTCNQPVLTAAILIPSTYAQVTDISSPRVNADAPPSYLQQGYDLAMAEKEIPFDVAIRIPVEQWTLEQTMRRTRHDNVALPELFTNIHALVKQLSTSDIDYVYKMTSDQWLTRFGFMHGRRFDKALRQVVLQQYHDVFPMQKEADTRALEDIVGWFFQSIPPSI